MIRQNMHHPCIFAWGLQNEGTNAPEFAAALDRLNQLAKREDPSRHTIASTNREDSPEINKFPDWLGWNRYPLWYERTPPAPMLDACRGTSRDGTYVLSEYGAGACVDQHQYELRPPVPKSNFHPEEWQA